MIELTVMRYKFLLKIAGLEIFLLSIFNMFLIFPVSISTTKSRPILVDKYILLFPIIKPVGFILGLIFFLKLLSK